jgi:2-desacetyl-2-hydroxyethyl bacteriochlorophyllide A dehydrogenase
MKAAVFVGVGKPLAIETLPDPTPEAGQLVLRVGRCGICGTDLHMTSGVGETFPDGIVLGHEFAGEVVAAGADTDGFAVGDYVSALPVMGCGMCGNCRSGEPAWCEQGLIGMAGGFGQYAIAKASAAIKLPKTMSLEDGALVEPLAVSLHGVNLAELRLGAKVAVLGAGPIGVGAAYWAKRAGAGKLAVTARSDRGERFARAMGADSFLLGGEDLAERVADALGGPPEVVFECAGVPGTIAQAIDLVGPRGTVIVLGNCMVPDSFYPAQAMFKQVRIQCSMIYSVAEFEAVAASFDAGHVEPRSMVTGTWSLDELPAGFEAMRERTTHCKAMVDPWVGHD